MALHLLFLHSWFQIISNLLNSQLTVISKKKIAFIIFFVVLCYIISPWFFEKKLLFTELISAIGIFILLYKQFPIIKTPIYLYIVILILWGIVHGITSLLRMDSFYYYLRNTVIVSSMFSFFIGFYCLKYLEEFIIKIRNLLRYYVSFFLFMPVSYLFFERYGMATVFPSLFKNGKRLTTLTFLIILNFIYAVTYTSSTSFVLGIFYIFILFTPGYKFFKQTVVVALVIFSFFFIVVQENLSLIKPGFSFYDEYPIKNVMSSNAILGLDPNNTWRLILWKQLIVDQFPNNLFGLGFGTPALTYYPVADFSKLSSLPYVLGAHNSYIYLFSRLGIIYLLLVIPIYSRVFREYFYFKNYYKQNNSILLFYSFFAISIISLFNPTLETPIFASSYWLLLGFVTRSIYNRQGSFNNSIQSENIIHT